jgi:hypothetical protein
VLLGVLDTGPLSGLRRLNLWPVPLQP